MEYSVGLPMAIKLNQVKSICGIDARFTWHIGGVLCCKYSTTLIAPGQCLPSRRCLSHDNNRGVRSGRTGRATLKLIN